jgi:hypothetical protein
LLPGSAAGAAALKYAKIISQKFLSQQAQKLFGGFNPPKERESHSSSQKIGEQRARLKTKDTQKTLKEAEVPSAKQC